MSSKSKEMAAYRLDGMEYALRLAKEKGIDGLEKEVRFRSQRQIDLKMSAEDIDRNINTIKELTIQTVLTQSIMVLRDEFDFGTKRLTRFRDRFMSKTEALCEGIITWEDQLRQIEIETGLQIVLGENVAGRR